MGAITKRNRERRTSMLVGVLAIVAGVALVGFALTATQGVPGYVPGVERTQVRVAFEDVGSLRAGDDARIANLRSGFVESIELEGQQPVVTIRLDGNRPVYKNATAALADRSVLGQKYVELDPGDESAGELPNSATIPAGSTSDVQQLDKLLDVFDAPTADATQSTLQEVGGGLVGRSEDLNDGIDALPTMLPDLGTVSNSLAAGEGRDLASMLATADSLASAFEGREQQIAELNGQLDTTLAAFNAEDGAALSEVLQRAPEALVETRSALDALRGPLADTESAMAQTLPGATALGESTPDLRGVLREGVPPLRRVPGVAESAIPAVTELTPAFTDAQPLSRQLGTTMDRAVQPLGVIAPYSPEVWRFFTNFAAANNRRDGDGHWLRVFLQFTQPESYIGTAPIEDPTVSRDPYPDPGQAPQQQERSVIGERAGE